MSNLEARPEEVSCGAVGVAEAPEWELLPGREVALGGTRAMGTAPLSEGAMMVSRTLPNRDRRMVGAWCFVDHFGGAERSHSGGAERSHSGGAERSHSGGAERSHSGGGPAAGGEMRVPPHPHTGLQTVTWLVEGAVRHRDSLGSDQLIRPGQLNLMTAGLGIAHSEVSPAPGRLHGVQLWVALSQDSRAVAPHFEHHADLPSYVDGAAAVTLLMGEQAGVGSPARTYTGLVGAQVAVAGPATLPLDPGFEYAALSLTGALEVGGRPLPDGPLLYLGRGRTDLQLAGTGQLLLLGGEPFDERIVMWWNFIGRSHDEIVADREDWMAGRRFGPVIGDEADPLPAPPMPTTPLKARGRLR